MHFFLLIIAAIVGQVLTIAVLPRQEQEIGQCIQSCSTNAETGACGNNVACLCEYQPFLNAVTECIRATCPANVVKEALAAGRTTCERAGVTLTPGASEPTAGSPSGSIVSGSASSPGGSAGPLGSRSFYTSPQMGPPLVQSPGTGNSAAPMTHGSSGMFMLAACLAFVGFMY